MSRRGDKGDGKAAVVVGSRSSFRVGLNIGVSALSLALVLHPAALQACAACYGQSDSPMAKGMNWGIFSLLAVVVVVLGGVASFFIYLARRARLGLPEPADASGLLASNAHRRACIADFAVGRLAGGADGTPVWNPALGQPWRPALPDSPDSIV
jgi:hypothetical protein